MKFQVPVTFDRASRRKDRTVSLTYTTNMEISPQDYMEMDKTIMLSGWLLFSSDEIQEADIPETRAPAGEKRPFAQQLRGIKWHQWQQQTDQSEPFEMFWERYKEKILQLERERLN